MKIFQAHFNFGLSASWGPETVECFTLKGTAGCGVLDLIGLTWCSGRQGIAPCCGAAWHWALTVSLLHTHTYTQIRMTLVVNGPDAWHAGWARSSRESGSATCCRPSFRREHPGVSLLWLHPAFGLNVAALIGAVIFGVTLCKLFRSDWKRADW